MMQIDPAVHDEEMRSRHHFPMASAIARVALSGSSAWKIALMTATPTAPATVI